LTQVVMNADYDFVHGMAMTAIKAARQGCVVLSHTQHTRSTLAAHTHTHTHTHAYTHTHTHTQDFSTFTLVLARLRHYSLHFAHVSSRACSHAFSRACSHLSYAAAARAAIRKMRKRVGHVMTVAAAEMDNTEDDAYRSDINDVMLRIEVCASDERQSCLSLHNTQAHTRVTTIGAPHMFASTFHHRHSPTHRHYPPPTAHDPTPPPPPSPSLTTNCHMGPSRERNTKRVYLTAQFTLSQHTHIGFIDSLTCDHTGPRPEAGRRDQAAPVEPVRYKDGRRVCRRVQCCCQGRV
jgi:hypothetical protein